MPLTLNCIASILFFLKLVRVLFFRGRRVLFNHKYLIDASNAFSSCQVNIQVHMYARLATTPEGVIVDN